MAMDTVEPTLQREVTLYIHQDQVRKAVYLLRP